ncbi:hypothetical protein BDP81DRAFT_417355 [Colletotrichum phormii]|uniref:Uncharacterized protein n=1 Tax=Colletotrichum phormii TaxID=359342 RepID=A0AAJ0A266_9PEZI|nr:uncharacterized protein BDP81DRAFT_417355 [Colletotrichum phormii]KAK1655100.1 hypothetical protein BDP81DRAFT_417355 [Colletotrichum phormii]
MAKQVSLIAPVAVSGAAAAARYCCLATVHEEEDQGELGMMTWRSFLGGDDGEEHYRTGTRSSSKHKNTPSSIASYIHQCNATMAVES